MNMEVCAAAARREPLLPEAHRSHPAGGHHGEGAGGQGLPRCGEDVREVALLPEAEVPKLSAQGGLGREEGPAQGRQAGVRGCNCRGLGGDPDNCWCGGWDFVGSGRDFVGGSGDFFFGGRDFVGGGRTGAKEGAEAEGGDDGLFGREEQAQGQGLCEVERHLDFTDTAMYTDTDVGLDSAAFIGALVIKILLAP